MSNLAIRLSVDGQAQVVGQLGQVDASVKRVGESARTAATGSEKLADSFAGLKRQAVGLLGAVGAGVLAREFIAQADAMALLDARLRNAVGGGKEFAAAQRDIYSIAQQNNVGLKETAQLYVRLAAPVQRLGGTVREVTGITSAFALALRVGGASAQEAASATLQFAQAMGSGRLQGDEFRAMAEASPRFLQALADGMGQPIERLKEMGSEGKLTADVVGNALLRSLGQLREEAQGLPDTVGGALTRLQNEALVAAVAFNEMTGAAGMVAETVGMAAGWVAKMTDATRMLDQDTRGLSGTVDLSAVAFGALGTILETVVVIGSDVAFVLRGIWREIVGIAAQAAAVLRGDFAAAGAIRTKMIADAERARAALDKFQASVSGATRGILAQRAALREHSLSAAENANEMARLSKHAAAAGDGYQRLRATVAEEADGSKKAAKEKEKAARELAAAQKKAASELAAAIQEYEKARASDLASNAKSIEGIEKELQALRDRYVEIVAGKAVLDDLVNVRIEDAAATHEQMAATMALAGENELAIAQHRLMAERLREQIVLRKAVASATASKEADAANAAAAKAAADEWQRAADQIGQSLADALMQGGKSAAEYIKSLFRTMVLRPIIQGVVSPVANATLGVLGLGASGSAASSGLGGASQYASMAASWFGSGSSLANGVSSLGSLFGSQALSSFAAGMKGATLAPGLMGPTTAGAGGAVGAGAAAAQAIPIAGWIAAGMMASNSLYKKGWTSDSLSAKNPFTSLTAVETRLLKGIGFNDKWANILTGAPVVARLFGRKAPEVQGQYLRGSIGGGGFDGRTDVDYFAKGGVFRRDKRWTDSTAVTGELDTFIDQGATQIRQSVQAYGAALALPVDKLAEVTQTIDLKIDGSAEDATRAITDALQKYADALGAQFADAMAPLRLSGETVVETMQRVGAALASVNDVMGALGKQLLNTSVAGGQAAVALADAFGGLDQLAQLSGAFYSAFYTDAERAARSTQVMTEALAEVGLALPASREAFRAVVDGLDVATDAGRRQFVVMMQLAGSFDQVAKVAEAAALETQRAAEAAARETQRAAEAAAQEAQRLAEESLARAQAVASEREQLEDRLLQAMGNTAELRARELARLDESNRALQQRVWALEDEQRHLMALAGAGQSIAQFVRELLGLGRSRSTSLESARRQYMADLSLAQAGDVEASGRITGSARDLVDALRATATDPIAFARETSRIAQQLKNLPATVAWEQQVLDNLAKLAKNTSAGGDLEVAIGEALAIAQATITLTLDSALPDDLKQIALGIAATVERTVRFVADADALPDDLRSIAVKTQHALLVGVQAVVSGQLPDAVRDLALRTQHALAVTVEAAVASNVPEDVKRLALRSLSDLAVTVNAAVMANLPDEVRQLALRAQHALAVSVGAALAANVSDDVRRLALRSLSELAVTVNAALMQNLPADVRSLALRSQHGLAVSVEAALAANVSSDVKALALRSLSELTVTVSAALMANLPNDVRSLALRAQHALAVTVDATLASTVGENVKRLALQSISEHVVAVNAVLAADIDADAKRLALQASSVFTVNVDAILNSQIPDELKRVLLEANSTATRAVTLNAALAEALTADQRSLLTASSETIRRVVEQAISSPTLTADQKAMLNALPQTIEQTLQQVLSTPAMTSEQKAMLWALPKTVAQTLQQLISSPALTADQKAMLNALPKTIEQTLQQLLSTPALTVEQKSLLWALPKTVAQTLQQLIASPALSTEQRALLNALPKTVAQTLEQVLSSPNMTADQRALLWALPKTVAQTLQQLVSSPALTADQKAILNALPKTIEQTLQQVLTSPTLTAEQRALLWALPKTVAQTLQQLINSPTLTADQRKLLDQTTGSVTRTINQLLNSPTLTDEQRALLEAISGSVAHQLNLQVYSNGAIEWDASDPLKSIFNGIRAAAENTYQLLVMASNGTLGLYVSLARNHNADGAKDIGANVINSWSLWGGPHPKVRVVQNPYDSTSYDPFGERGMLDELRALRHEVAGLRAEQAAGLGATAAANNKVVRLLDRVTDGGQAMITATA